MLREKRSKQEVIDGKWVEDLLKMFSLGHEHPQTVPFQTVFTEKICIK